jgi:WD40 repeat protein
MTATFARRKPGDDDDKSVTRTLQLDIFEATSVWAWSHEQSRMQDAAEQAEDDGYFVGKPILYKNQEANVLTWDKDAKTYSIQFTKDPDAPPKKEIKAKDISPFIPKPSSRRVIHLQCRSIDDFQLSRDGLIFMLRYVDKSSVNRVAVFRYRGNAIAFQVTKVMQKLRGDKIQNILISADGSRVLLVARGKDNMSDLSVHPISAEENLSLEEETVAEASFQAKSVRTPESAIAVSYTGKLVAVGTMENIIHIFNVDDNALVQILTKDDWVLSVSFSEDAQRLVAWGADQMAHIWSLADLTEAPKIITTDCGWGGPNWFALNDDGSYLAGVTSTSDQHRLRVWDLRTDAEVMRCTINTIPFGGSLTFVGASTILPFAVGCSHDCLFCRGRVDALLQVWQHSQDV